MQSEVFTGARAVFKISGMPVGYALACNGTTGINYQPLNVLGHLEVAEHVPVAYTVEMGANLARVAQASRLAQFQNFPGLRPDVEGSLNSPQIMPSFGTNGTAILTSGELTAVIYDVVTQETLYTIQGVKCSSKAWEIQGGGMVAENCAFVARISTELNESEQPIGT